ncbi:MAG: ribulose-phosphate 3-epimerase [Longicatena sp.]|jgi:ribulose-phosphate 3-epimerase|uniref:ribulose-phosphate 3-epimerase n=1 Tax=Anaerorhabdus sp. TaxID=1872524 RepID=UPI002FCA1872
MIIAPSVLSIDFCNLNQQLKEVEDANAKWIHFDVMDGHFVPNLTFGPDILKAFRKMTDLFLDVHIMVSDPVFFADVFIDAGANMITFHYEACKDKEACIELARSIRSKGCKAGISIKPNTNVESILDIVNEFDLVLVMSVEPGFGGQSFIPEALNKIKKLKDVIVNNHYETLIEVDGGINQETGKLCKESGADVLVAGSYVFKNNIKDAVASLC